MGNTVSNVATLSSSTAGRGIAVAATASPGTALHNPGTSNTDQIELDAVSLHSADVTLTIEWGGTSAADQIKVTLHPGEGMRLVQSVLLTGNLAIAAFASVASVVNIHGRALRIV